MQATVGAYGDKKRGSTPGKGTLSDTEQSAEGAELTGAVARRPAPPYRVWCSPPIYNFYEVYPYFRGANLIMNHDLPPVTSWKQAVNDSNNVTHEVTYAGAANPVYAQEGMTIMKGAPGPNAEEPCSMTNTTMVRCLRAFLTIPVV